MTLADRIVVMNNRRIEQIGAPMEIYDRPATRFVAGFVGSPAMNFMEARIDRSGPNLSVKVADGIVIATEIASDQFADKAYTFGIRSEDVRIGPNGQGHTDGVVDVIERLGERTLAYVRLGDGQQIVGSDAGNSRIRVGDSVGLTFDGAKSHLFDETGNAWHAREA